MWTGDRGAKEVILVVQARGGRYPRAGAAGMELGLVAI